MTMRDLLARMTGTRFARDDRGISFSVNYVTTVGITAILIIGLIAGVGTVLDNQQDRAITHQADVIGDQAAAGVMATDRLGSVGDRTNATVTRDLPSEVVGTPYRVLLVNYGDQSFVLVEALRGEYQSRTPIDVDGNVQETIVEGGAEMEIVHLTDPETGERELFIRESDQSQIGAAAADDSFFEVTITDLNPDPAEEGDTVFVDAEIENTGDETSSQQVELEILEFGVVDTQTVLLDSGDTTEITLEWSSAEQSGEDFETAIVESADTEDLRTFDVEENPDNEPSVEVTDFDMDDVTDEEEFTTDVTVEESNNVETDDLEITLEVNAPDGSTVYDETIAPDEINGESTTVTFGIDDGTPELGPFDADEDDYTATASVDTSNGNDDSQSTSFNVDEGEAPASFEVTVTDAPDEVGYVEAYDAEVEVENTGDEMGTETVELEIDGEGVIDDVTVANLDGGDTRTVTLTWNAGDRSPGDYTGSVSAEDDTDDISVTVLEPPRITDLTVTDESDPSPAGQDGEVVYEVDYTIDDPDGELDRVEIEFQNEANPGSSETLTETGTTGSLRHEPGQQASDYGDEYVITVFVYSESGEVEEERVVIEDRADGEDP